MVWMCTKVMSLSSSRKSGVRGCGSQNDGLKIVVDCERVHVFESEADFADFTEVGLDIVLGVAVPCHETSNLECKKDSLHVLVLERESSEKGFPYELYVLSTQKLGRSVVVKTA